MFTQLICSSKDLNPEGLNSRIQSVNYNIGLPFTEYWAHQWSPHFKKDAEQIKTNLAGKQQENRNIENPVLWKTLGISIRDNNDLGRMQWLSLSGERDGTW